MMGTSRKVAVEAGRTIVDLHRAGHSQRAIARQLGLDHRTVGRWLARGGAGEGVEDPKAVRSASTRSEAPSEAAGELEVLRELAEQLRGMLRGAALAPADFARLGAELRATLKSIRVVEGLARLAHGEASKDDAAAWVRAKLERMAGAPTVAGKPDVTRDYIGQSGADEDDEPRKVSAR